MAKRLKNAPAKAAGLSGNFIGSMSRASTVPAASPSKSPRRSRFMSGDSITSTANGFNELTGMNFVQPSQGARKVVEHDDLLLSSCHLPKCLQHPERAVRHQRTSNESTKRSASEYFPMRDLSHLLHVRRYARDSRETRIAGYNSCGANQLALTSSGRCAVRICDANTRRRRGISIGICGSVWVPSPLGPLWGAERLAFSALFS